MKAFLLLAKVRYKSHTLYAYGSKFPPRSVQLVARMINLDA